MSDARLPLQRRARERWVGRSQTKDRAGRRRRRSARACMQYVVDAPKRPTREVGGGGEKEERERERGQRKGGGRGGRVRRGGNRGRGGKGEKVVA